MRGCRLHSRYHSSSLRCWFRDRTPPATSAPLHRYLKLAVTQQLTSGLLHLVDGESRLLVTLGRLLCQSDRLGQVGFFPGQIHVVDRCAVGLGGALGPQPQGERANNGCDHRSPPPGISVGRQGAHRVVAGGSEDKAAQLIPCPLHKQVQSPVQLATLLPGKGAALVRTQLTSSMPCAPHVSPPPIPDTERPAGLPVKRTVFRPQIQVAVVEQHPHRNGADLGLLPNLWPLFAMSSVDAGMEQPSPFAVPGW